MVGCYCFLLNSCQFNGQNLFISFIIKFLRIKAFKIAIASLEYNYFFIECNFSVFQKDSSPTHTRPCHASEQAMQPEIKKAICDLFYVQMITPI